MIQCVILFNILCEYLIRGKFMDAKQIIEDLKKLGIEDNDTILVHSLIMR